MQNLLCKPTGPCGGVALCQITKAELSSLGGLSLDLKARIPTSLCECILVFLRKRVCGHQLHEHLKIQQTLRNSSSQWSTREQTLRSCFIVRSVITGHFYNVKEAHTPTSEPENEPDPSLRGPGTPGLQQASLSYRGWRRNGGLRKLKTTFPLFRSVVGLKDHRDYFIRAWLLLQEKVISV